MLVQSLRNFPQSRLHFLGQFLMLNKYKSSSDIYAKGTPIHCRGALLYNHYIKEKKLDNKYSLIKMVKRLSSVILKKPNIIHENIISFIQDFPHELGLDKYIDYDLQFEKVLCRTTESNS